mgnify:CR=1 FL=1
MTSQPVKEREGQLTIEQVLYLAVALRQGLLLVCPLRALGLEFNFKGLLRILELLQLRLVLVRLVSQLLGQAVSLLFHLEALLLLGVQHGSSFTHLLPQGGIGSCRRQG